MMNLNAIIIYLIILFLPFRLNPPPVSIGLEWHESSPLQDILTSLGENQPPHNMKFTEEQVRQGEEIVKMGYTIGPVGKVSKRVSKFFECTSCHNVEREDPDLRVSDPERRLAYVKEKGIPFLQGTTFKGIVNRESWYNDDYVDKYGDEKIARANTSLRQAIQLCAIECSQGRAMEKWEIDAVLAYFWSLQYHLDDLDFNAEDLQILKFLSRDTSRHQVLQNWLKSYYSQKSPAHFFDAPTDKYKGYKDLKGRPDKGKDIYELSCLFCHKSAGVSHYTLDHSKLSFQHLKKKIPKDSHFSLYQIIAYGTYAIPGHRPYMPHYPLERMSKQQVEDLRAYIEQQAE